MSDTPVHDPSSDGFARFDPTTEPDHTLRPPKRKKPFLLRRLMVFLFILLISAFLVLHYYVLALRFIPAPVTLNMAISVANGQTLTRRNIPLTDISDNLIMAVIAAEDARFCTHKGLDFDAISQALDHNKAGGKRRGGSTISQQTAKNIFFWNGGGLIRKAGEAWMTLVTEIVWGKRRIMTHYLNVAEWGDGIYGAESASRTRFGKSADRLTTREAALLAAVLPSPNKWRVDPPGNYVARRANTIQQRMRIVRSDGLADCVLRSVKD